MWGTRNVVEIPAITAAADPQTTFGSQQLARVNYGRPETWSFLFLARIIAAPDAGLLTVNIAVDFNLIVGLGRSIADLPGASPFNTPARGFCRFVFSYTGAATGIVGQTLWTTAVRTPNLEAGAAEIQSLDRIPAQDIQCEARCAAFANGTPAPAGLVQVDCGSWFAPQTHVRPEWFRDTPGDGLRFRGVEHNGK
jgi:hypothetical protein